MIMKILVANKQVGNKVISYRCAVNIGGGHDSLTLWPVDADTIMLWLDNNGRLWLEFIDANGIEHKHMIHDLADIDFMREE